MIVKRRIRRDETPEEVLDRQCRGILRDLGLRRSDVLEWAVQYTTREPYRGCTPQPPKRPRRGGVPGKSGRKCKPLLAVSCADGSVKKYIGVNAARSDGHDSGIIYKSIANNTPYHGYVWRYGDKQEVAACA